MPRHESPPLYADSRLNRPHLDALPTHRRCAACEAVLPLDADHYYEDRTRRPWNLSRFGKRCRPCASAAAADRAKSKRDARNARDRQRRAEYRALQAQGSLTLHLHLRKSQAAKRIAEVEQGTRMALYRRRLRRADRLRGPYTDPVKKMIRLRQEEYATRQHETAEAVERAHALRHALIANEKQRDSFEALQALRTLHRQQASAVKFAASAGTPYPASNDRRRETYRLE